jgi:hypothetical protein
MASSNSCSHARGPGKNGRVVLNVGGKRFETLVETLCKFPNTMLGAMFSSNMAVPDENGEYFFDRDPKMFEVILNFYRHGKILIPINRSPEMVKEELDFFGVNVEEYTEGLGVELKREADFIAQRKLTGFLDDFLIPRLKQQAQLGHYTFEVGFVPERHSMNNMTNLPSLPKNSDFYDLFSERENRKRLTKILKALKVSSQWDRSEQVNITTKEFLFECFKLTCWWSEDVKVEQLGQESPVSTVFSNTGSASKSQGSASL